MSLEQCLKERCCELQDEVTSLKSEKVQKKSLSRDSSIKIGMSYKQLCERMLNEHIY